MTTPLLIHADSMRDVKVFQAGTKMDGKTLVTDGGRAPEPRR